MKVGITTEGFYRLEAETVDDFDLLGSWDHYRVARVRATGRPAGAPSATNVIVLELSASVPNAMGKAVGCLSQSLCLGLRQDAFDSHVFVHPADPKPKVELTAVLEKLQLVVEALSSLIRESEFVGEKVDGAHVDSSENGSPSVSERSRA